jgi:hypothetical protein
MQWFRKHLGHGSRLALLTLAIQYVATFGHFHPLQIAQPVAFETTIASVVATDSTTAAQGTATTATAAEDQTRGSDPHHQPDPADICSICAVMALADTALPAAPPVLLPPQQAAELLAPTPDAAFVHLDHVAAAFQSRAPPVS